MTSKLKNVSRKRDQASMAISASELGDEGASARLAGGGKDPLWRPLLHNKRKRDVSQRRHMGIEVERLKHHADLTPHRVDVGGTRRDIDPADLHRTGRWLLQAVAAAQQGTLACSRGSDDKHQFLRQYEKVN